MTDSWTPPPSSSTDYAGGARSPVGQFESRLRRMEAALAALARVAPLRQAGVRVTDGGLFVDGGMHILGDLSSTGDTKLGGELELGGNGVVTGRLQSEDYVAGEAGWRLTPTGLEVNDIELRGGIIGNDALSNPVEVGQDGVTAAGFGVSTTAAAKSAGVCPVPDGFSKALVLASAHAVAFNSTTAPEFLYVGAQIGPVAPAYIPHPVPAEAWVAGAGSASRVMTGLTTGSVIDVRAMARSHSAAWAANPGALATVDAIVLFLR